MSRTNRLLILSVDFLPHIGGISIMTHHLANAFSDSGLQTMVVAPSVARVPDDMQQRYQLFEDQQANRIVREGPKARLEDERIVALLGSIHRDFQHDRILLAHPFYYGLGALNHVRQARIPLSAVFYGFELRSQLVRRISFGKTLRNIVKRTPDLRNRTLQIVRRADQLLPISNYTAGLLRDAGTRRPMLVTGCGIPCEDLNREISQVPSHNGNEKQLLRVQLGLSRNPTIGFVGRLVESKNVDFLLRVVSQVSGLNAAVIGDGPDAEKLRAAAQRYGVADRVHWIGAVGEDAKWAYLRAFDAFCLFSKEMPQGQVEGFGIVLLEATAAGTPVIAARSGGMTDVVVDGKNGFLCEIGNVSEAVEKLAQLLNSPSLAGGFVQSARSQIKERFNWAEIALAIRASWATA